MTSRRQLQTLIENEQFQVDRSISSVIDATHSHIECVTLFCPRKIGKTTLATTYYKDKMGAVYRDLQKPDAKEEIGNGSKFFERHKDSLIVLDEIQECEYLFPNIKVHIDRQRRAENDNCKFLLLCSASLELQRRSMSSLTGRHAMKEMTGILLLELLGAMSDKIHVSSGDELPESYKSVTELLMFRGGMPLSLFAKSDSESKKAREYFVASDVGLDLGRYGLNVDKITIEQCLKHIASVNGKQFEIGTFTSKLSRTAGKVRDAMSALEQLLLLRVLEPWSEVNGRSAKVSKHSKVYIRDSGLLTHLLNLKSVKSLLDGVHKGSVWEGFVIESLIGTAQCARNFGNGYFYRTHKGDSELDFVLEFDDGAIWGVEIKYSEPKTLKAGNIEAAKTVGACRRLVIHNGTRSYQINGGFEAMPLHKALEAVRDRKSDWDD